MSFQTNLNPPSGDEELPPILIGNLYTIKRNNIWKKAEVLQERTKNNDIKEYYVHYKDSDRRLDEWVLRDCLKPCEEYMSSCDVETVGDDGLVSCRAYITRARMKSNSNGGYSSGESSDEIEKEHERLTKVKYIDCVQFGKYEIQTWYFSPYPEEYGQQSKLFVCEYCLKYMKLETSYCYHLGDCKRRCPPGNMIYTKGTLSVYEVIGDDNRIYCQNLCLFAKLFIDHKTIFFDVEQFVFYVLCDRDTDGDHMVGYFSKDRFTNDGHNLACILTLPPHQKRGYGKLLIAFSYELSKLEGVVGTPEKPFSDLGELSYLSYWSWVLLDVLNDTRGEMSLTEISMSTGITYEDLLSTLKYMKLLKCLQNPNKLVLPVELIRKKICCGKYKRPKLTVDSSCVNWEPPNNFALFNGNFSSPSLPPYYRLDYEFANINERVESKKSSSSEEKSDSEEFYSDV